MASSTLKMATNALIKMLIDNEIALFVKEMILYCLVMSGCKNTLSIVKLNCFAKVKPRKLRFELVDEDHIFFVAYAFCFSRLAFTSVTNLDKVAFAVERIYKKLKGKNILGIEKEEMAAYIAFQCGYKDFKREKDILRLFGADKNEYNALKGLVENLDED